MISWLFIHPADVIKVRMQLSTTNPHPTIPPYRGLFHAASVITRTEGIAAMYSGLSAALTRQLTYTTLRLGFYATLRAKVEDADGGLAMWKKFGVGMIAGGGASAISTPVEVAMVRMYADGAKEEGKRRGYRNVGNALWRIGTEEGLRGLWSGVGPTVGRSMVVNCVQLGTYDQAKETYRKFGVPDGIGLHGLASATSGLVYSTVSLPIDNAKTRMQEQGKGGRYKGLVGSLITVGREEGVRSLWKGFVPYFSRCAGHTVAMFLVLEQVSKVI